MNVRQIQPGERLSPDCGHHCGIRSAAEEGSRLTFIGHCTCDECRCPMSGPWLVNIPAIDTERRLPMCMSLTGGDTMA